MRHGFKLPGMARQTPSANTTRSQRHISLLRAMASSNDAAKWADIYNVNKRTISQWRCRRDTEDNNASLCAHRILTEKTAPLTQSCVDVAPTIEVVLCLTPHMRGCTPTGVESARSMGRASSAGAS
ncbi:hypothetical protein CBM2633_P210015 [Cupriavidus taiwanensis]|uniref:Uncharacterized protein n=3 Tax=Cupriavidus TaxID=106589 RepID=A0A375CN12_9BURK|nr:hypothetical protein pRALTA_0365 [Cupriavidus taiwanensis LMG 19424]SOY74917.1 hypothetical protein CBM2588_P230015 [Cupriavidus taiwanensis]SOZ40491.1 hypothetical protein CBM2605_P210018 [Cupriavidus neocaledonicus]SOY74927.1 hypothetical protein CBM2585_P210015 [Cupriavidus taiwanensis]SOY74933.1 hypothetical protein CBM2592_P240020 [Cupriavidus taiwanensis]